MQVQLHSDVAGRQLLIDLMDVDDKFTDSNAPSKDIIEKFFGVFNDKSITSSSIEEENHFVLISCGKTFLITVCGYSGRKLITIDVRIHGETDFKEIEDWLVHEYRPGQLARRTLDRGNASGNVESNVRKIRNIL